MSSSSSGPSSAAMGNPTISGPRSAAMENSSGVTRSPKPWKVSKQKLSSEQKLALAIGIIGTAIVGISWATGANLTDICIAEGSVLATVATLLLCDYFMRRTEKQSAAAAVAVPDAPTRTASSPTAEESAKATATAAPVTPATAPATAS